MKYEVDTTYQTIQRDIFTSGLVKKIKSEAFLVYSAIKSYAAVATGEASPTIRQLKIDTGIGSTTMQKALKTLEDEKLLRIVRKGNRNYYIARERIDLRIGERVICTVVADYVPLVMRQLMQQLKDADADTLASANIWANVELIPGEGFTQGQNGALTMRMRADEIPEDQEDPARKFFSEAWARLPKI